MRDAQKKLFNTLKAKCREDQFALWVSKTLCVGRSAAYRKIKGESGLEWDEALRLIRAAERETRAEAARSAVEID